MRHANAVPGNHADPLRGVTPLSCLPMRVAHLKACRRRNRPSEAKKARKAGANLCRLQRSPTVFDLSRLARGRPKKPWAAWVAIWAAALGIGLTGGGVSFTRALQVGNQWDSFPARHFEETDVPLSEKLT